MIKHNMEQGSYEWHQIRTGKLTSTGLSSVIAKSGKPILVIDELIAEEISGMSDDDGYVNDKMQRGLDLEPLARSEYESTTGNKVEQVGFLQSDKWNQLGVSADSLVGKTGAIEIKCPDTKTHVRYIRENKIPADYFAQVLCYFLVHEDLQWLDFISYDPRFIVQPMFIKRITRDELAKDIEAATVKLDEFFALYEATKNRIVFGETYEVSYLVEPPKQ